MDKLLGYNELELGRFGEYLLKSRIVHHEVSLHARADGTEDGELITDNCIIWGHSNPGLQGRRRITSADIRE